jgi:predicted ATPase/transcriptional regulator with XRE-family HTH domain
MLEHCPVANDAPGEQRGEGQIRKIAHKVSHKFAWCLAEDAGMLGRSLCEPDAMDAPQESEATWPFARHLREARYEANLTQAALAERARLSIRTIEHLEEGRGQPYADTLRRLVEALQLIGEARTRFELAGRRRLPARAARADETSPTRGLPLALTRFVGREQQLTLVAELLANPAVRLVTLTGAGGTGKTRVALEAATRLLDQFRDGVHFVDLAAIRDPSATIAAIARSLGIRDLGRRPVLESLRSYLVDRRLLLLLDNFEQILPAGPEVTELLTTCPELKILVTSRAALHVRGEHQIPIPPMAVPGADQPQVADQIAGNEAATLFLERAAEVRPELTLCDENAGTVAEICRRLDGLPLALELAAARARWLPLAAVLSRLELRLPLLTSGPRDVPDRQRSLAATIAWSYELLDETEKTLFRHLAVFVGGCTLEALDAVRPAGCQRSTTPTQEHEIELLDRVSSILDMNLLRQEQGPDGEPRFTMLETIREYAMDQLETSGEAESARRRHAVYFLRFVETARPHLRGSAARVWLDRLDTDHNNISAALDWAEAVAEDSAGPARGGERLSGLELAARIVEAASWFWMLRSHLVQGWQRVQRLLSRAPSGTAAHARLLLVAGTLAHFKGDDPDALRLSTESLQEARELGDRRHIALALARMGDAQVRLGSLDRARALLEESQALSDDAYHKADLEHPIFVKLAMASWVGGDFDRACPLFEQGVAVGRAEGDIHTTLLCLRYLGLLSRQQGDAARSRALHEEALGLASELGDYPCTMYALAGLAYIAAENRDALRAAHLLGAVSRLHELTGMSLSPSSAAGGFEHAVDEVRNTLDDQSFAEAWSEGRAMPLDRAVSVALWSPRLAGT